MNDEQAHRKFRYKSTEENKKGWHLRTGSRGGLITLRLEPEYGVGTKDGEALGLEGPFEMARVSPGSAGLKCGVMEAPGFGHAEVRGDTRM